MNMMTCNTCRDMLPDLLLEPETGGSAQTTAHLAECADCRRELDELRSTFSLLDEWTAPEPSAFFDSRLHARLRELQEAPPESLWQRFADFLRFSTSLQLRPALAGVLLFIVLLGGGTVATVLLHQGSGPAASPTVNDLKIYDNNAQALQEMDILDDASSDAGNAPQS